MCLLVRFHYQERKLPSPRQVKRRNLPKRKTEKNFRKSLRSQSLPECNSSGSDLETHFAPQTKRKCKQKTPSEKPASKLGESMLFWKKDSHTLVMIMEMILTHQPPTAVSALGLITEKAMETN